MGLFGKGNIANCINNGKAGGGIAAWVRGGEVNIINCYNFGECAAGIVKGFCGQNWEQNLELNILNCYNLGKTSDSGIIGSIGYIGASIILNIENCYNAGETNKAILGAKSGSTLEINITNTYYDQSKSTSVGVTAEGITALDEAGIKNNSEFIKLLNDNIGENTEWKKWKIGEDGWPTFE